MEQRPVLSERTFGCCGLSPATVHCVPFVGRWRRAACAPFLAAERRNSWGRANMEKRRRVFRE